MACSGEPARLVYSFPAASECARCLLSPSACVCVISAARNLGQKKTTAEIQFTKARAWVGESGSIRTLSSDKPMSIDTASQ